MTREVDLIEEIARVRMDEVPFTLPVRRAMFGSLTPLQRLRRRVEDVLVGLGLVRDLHAVARAGGGRARRSGSAGPDGRSGGAQADAPARPGRRRRAKRRRSATSGSACSRSPASTSRAATTCRRSSCTSAASSRAVSRAAKGVVESLYRGAQGGAAHRARRQAVSLPRARRARRRGLARRAAPEPPRGNVGCLRARPRSAARRVARPDPVRGRDHVPGRQAGPRLHRRRGRGRRRPDRSRPRGGGPGAARAARLRRLSRRAGRPGQEVDRARRRVPVAGADALRRGGRRDPRADRRGAGAAATARSCAPNVAAQSDSARPA